MAERLHIQRKKGDLETRAAAYNAEATHQDPGLATGVRNTISSGGHALDHSTRAALEPQFGYDFSQVRIHTDDRAAESAQSLNAQAYTVGPDVVFGEGAYTPQSSTGQRLIAHELAHVVQQSSGPVAGSLMTQGVSVSQPSDTFEQAADQAADLAVSGSPAAAAAQAPAGAAAPSVQRKEDEEPEQLEGAAPGAEELEDDEEGA